MTRDRENSNVYTLDVAASIFFFSRDVFDVSLSRGQFYKQIFYIFIEIKFINFFIVRWYIYDHH